MPMDMDAELLTTQLSEGTIHYLDFLDNLKGGYPDGYAPVLELKEALIWKGVYIPDYRGWGGRETIRTTLRLFCGDLDNSLQDPYFDEILLPLEDIRTAFITLDGFYGSGLRKFITLLGFSSAKEFTNNLRLFPHGEQRKVIAYKEEPVVQEYAFDPAKERSLVVEVTRKYNGHSFGHFLFYGSDRYNLCIEDLQRVLEDTTPTIRHESVRQQ